MTEIFEWLAWGTGVVLSLAALPGSVLMFSLTLAALISRPRRAVSHAKSFRLCALVPAHDEELLIARCVKSLLASGGPEFKVYVVADNCGDSTASGAAEAGACVLVRTDPLRRGKGHALNYGFTRILAAGADGVLVIDADSVVSSNLVGAARDGLAAGADAVQCRYRVIGRRSNLRSRLMDLAFLGFNVLRPLGRDRLGLSAGVLGNGFAVSRSTLESTPYTADSIVEDLEYHIHLVRTGHRVRFVNEATVYGEIPGDGVTASSQRARWEGGRLRMLVQWVPRLARDVSRGQARCLEPLVELLALPLAYHTLLLTILIVIAPHFIWWLTVVQVGILMLYVVTAACKGEDFPTNLGTLAIVPFYVLWKLTLLLRIVRSSRPDTNWTRTGRQSS